MTMTLTAPRLERTNVAAPRRQRAEGRLAISVSADGGRTRVERLAESGAARLRLPRADVGLEAVMLNVAGGLACGDVMSVEALAGAGATLSLATPGAERVYRSDGPDTTVSTRLEVCAGASLLWAPQETILFDRARLVRRLDAEVAPDAALTVYEGVAFGRKARGEKVETGLLEDRWRVSRGGRLAFAETLSLRGPVSELLARKTVAGGASAIATILHMAPHAEARLDPARDALAAHPAVESGASAWNGMLVVRLLAPSSERVRDAARALLPLLLGRPLPRVWTC